MRKKNIELLSPAGSFECMQAALQAGADAVYFGVEQLNMRAKSVNSFQLSDLKEIKTICDANDVKTYLTLNTVMYQHDMQLLRSILNEAKKQNIDGIIGSDFAVMEYCKQLNLPLHVSTQANVSNIESVKFFSSFADTIVLARELTLKQVNEITSEITRKKIRAVSGELIKIEVFAHGALCMAVSGKCYLSLHAQNSSANRGACNQQCRHSYKVTDLETNEELVIDNEYIMSPKDLCTIDILDQVLDSGVDILKIEGRSKGPDYVYEVTSCYREAIDALQNGTYTREKILQWQNRLKKVYNRGFWEGYYLGRKLGEWTASPSSAAAEKKIFIGKGTKYYPRIKVGEFLLQSGSIHSGDLLMITGRDFGVKKARLDKLVVNGKVADKAIKGDLITFPFEEKVTSTDKLYKIIEAENA